MITYKTFKENSTTVYLDGKIVGHIETTLKGSQYFPRGSKSGGEIFSTIEKVKKSLEQE